MLSGIRFALTRSNVAISANSHKRNFDYEAAATHPRTFDDAALWLGHPRSHRVCAAAAEY